jgi:23S rRNA pseudouridine1911/1915/1917 synthase
MTSDAFPVHRLRVSAEEEGMRLERFLRSRFPGFPRRDIVAWIDSGRVRCDGRSTRKGFRLWEGLQVEAEALPVRGPATVLPDAGRGLRILWEDAWLVALDKPPGCSSLPLRTEERGSVANALVSRYPEMQGIGYGEREPGLVHRLDRDTSGVLLAARTQAAFQNLREQFELQRVVKIYLAVVWGKPSPVGTVNLPIGSRGRRAQKVVVYQGRTPRGRLRHLNQAETSYRVMRSCGSYSLVHLVMRTGVRHQIRAHMACLGHPVAGDLLYGPKRDAWPGPVPPLRQLLHASEIRFFHPEDGREVVIACPLPEDFQDFLQAHDFG